jgi:predicted nucleic acid-binding protein
VSLIWQASTINISRENSFLDTVGLLAIWNEDDQWHQTAENGFHRVVAGRCAFVTSTFVLAECANAAARHAFRADVIDLGERLKSAGGLITPSDADWEQAWRAYGASHVGGPGLVDELSFVLMRRLNLRHAFTNDRHFLAAGFELLF